MALTTCSECKHQVSEKAKACPHCGAKLKMGIFKKSLLIFFGLVIVGSIFSESAKSPSENNNSLSPEEKAAAEKAKKRKDEAFTRVVQVLHSIKSAAREPESVKWENILGDEDANIVCVEYRAKNGFGGYSKGLASFYKGKIHTDVSSWNQWCAGKTLVNYSHAEYAIPRVR